MDELIRWTDNDRARRRYTIKYDGSKRHGAGQPSFLVRVWIGDEDNNPTIVGHGHGETLNFAAVRALIDFEKEEGAS